MDKHKVYKYLGFQQNAKMNPTNIRQHLQKQYKSNVQITVYSEKANGNTR